MNPLWEFCSSVTLYDKRNLLLPELSLWNPVWPICYMAARVAGCLGKTKCVTFLGSRSREQVDIYKVTILDTTLKLPFGL